MSDICTWLEELGLEQYGDAFEESAIDARVLSELTDADLRELGVSVMATNSNRRFRLSCGRYVI